MKNILIENFSTVNKIFAVYTNRAEIIRPKWYCEFLVIFEIVLSVWIFGWKNFLFPVYWLLPLAKVGFVLKYSQKEARQTEGINSIAFFSRRT